MNSIVAIVALIGFALYGIGSIIEYRREEKQQNNKKKDDDYGRGIHA